MFSGTSPGPPVSSPPLTATKVHTTTPLHEALKLKKLHDAAVKDYLEQNKSATKADLDKFREQFVAQTRPATAGTTSSSSSGQKLPVNRNLTGAFFDQDDENSNVRPTVFLGRHISPPKVQIPIFDDNSAVAVSMFDDNASMSSDGMSAAMTMQTSSKPPPPLQPPLLPPSPETPTIPKPSISVFTPPLWPFPSLHSLQNKDVQNQEQSSISLWSFGTTAASSSSATPTQPIVYTVDENPNVHPSAINIDNNKEQPQIPSSPNLILWPFSTARFAPVMPFTFGTAEVPVSREVSVVEVVRTATEDSTGGSSAATVPGGVSPRKQNRRDLSGFVDPECSYLDSSMAGFVANRELIDGRIKELERGAHGSDG